MAITSDGFTLTVTVLDSAMDASTLTYRLLAAEYEAALTAAESIVTRLSGVTNAAVKQWTLSHNYSEKALSLPAGVNIEERATVALALDGFPNKNVVINIPAPKTSLFASVTGPTANQINPAAAALQTYVSIWHAGANGLASISDGERVKSSPNAGIVAGRRTHRASSWG